MSGIPTRNEMKEALIARNGRQLQETLEASTVAICGLGGLGSNIAVSLARVGIGKLILIDFDKVDVSNLNRQQYKASQVGAYKPDALSRNLKEIAPYINLISHPVKLNEDNMTDILKDADIICEAFDDAEAKAMITNHVLETFPDKYLITASGMAGLDSANNITTRKITDRFYLCGDGVSDLKEGSSLIASRVMLCAAHQAHIVLRILAGLE